MALDPDSGPLELPPTGALRTPLGRAAGWLTGPAGRPGHVALRSLYLRGLGAVFFCAFASWYAQQDGLIGSQGIAPAAEYLARLRESLGGPSFLQLPTLLWLDASDAALAAVALGGLACSLLLVLGLVPIASLALCWLLYLSLSSAGSLFMHYQWDALLLEAAAMSLLLAPPVLRLSRATVEPHPIAVLLPRFLLLRLMLLSGLVKLQSGDPTWRGLTALDYHFWSQPLPTWTAWIAAAAPPALHAASTAVMLAIELGAPLFVLLPRRLRLPLGFAPLVFLQLVILATGNYGFFNLLTLVLCLSLLDDRALGQGWAWLRRRRLEQRGLGPGRSSLGLVGWLRSLLASAAFGLVLTVSIAGLQLSWFGDRVQLPPWEERLLAALSPFRSLNSYGLFASMTTDRVEIALEGSDDGQRWLPYRFAWKPGDPRARPRFATPHMPRLDWQMWFAALSDCRKNPWFVLLQQRLFEGKKPVGALFAENPFPDHPPRYLRSPTARYRFSDWRTLRQTGAWWTVEPLGPFCPTLTFEGGVVKKAGGAAR